jgi:carboxyl-terminal processing protease
MNFRKFIIPNIAILIVLSAFWFAGIDPVVKPSNARKTNIQKYAETQRKILDNYVDKVNIDKLYKYSIHGFVLNLTDSASSLKNTPLDTTFAHLHINSVRQSVNKFKDAYQYMASHYPNVDMNRRTVDAIRGMFKLLDPHSIYIKASKSKGIKRHFNGKYQGVGIEFNIVHDTIMVVSPIAGGPSDKLGIRSGDRIIAIDDSSAIGFSIQDVRDHLLGPKGTKVSVSIKRPRVDHLLHFTITRAEIPLYTVSTSYMLNDHKTGYIKINRFAATTHKEFMNAVYKLQKEGMKRLMIDLRGNPGGYLGQAIAVASEFYPKGTEIVSTKSRHPRFTDTYYSQKEGDLQHIPLIIMVNKGTASASEIVSGAIQDHDRGLIVGQRTFGKGLVQQQYALVDSSKIRVTIAHYYTPSGRLIQKPYRSSENGFSKYEFEIYNRPKNAFKDVKQYLSGLSDSLIYHTDAGRDVYSGGGIVPDHIIQEDTSRVLELVNDAQQTAIPAFVRDYLDKNGQYFRNEWADNFERFRNEFTWKQSDFNKLLAIMKKQQSVAISDTLSVPEYRSGTLYIPKKLYNKAKKEMGGIMKARLAEEIWGQKKYFPVFNDVFDHAIQQSMGYWHQAKEFANGHVSVKKQHRFQVQTK